MNPFESNRKTVVLRKSNSRVLEKNVIMVSTLTGKPDKMGVHFPVGKVREF